jgi:hypothetical protein
MEGIYNEIMESVKLFGKIAKHFPDALLHIIIYILASPKISILIRYLDKQHLQPNNERINFPHFF